MYPYIENGVGYMLHWWEYLVYKWWINLEESVSDDLDLSSVVLNDLIIDGF